MAPAAKPPSCVGAHSLDLSSAGSERLASRCPGRPLEEGTLAEETSTEDANSTLMLLLLAGLMTARLALCCPAEGSEVAVESVTSIPSSIVAGAAP